MLPVAPLMHLDPKPSIMSKFPQIAFLQVSSALVPALWSTTPTFITIRDQGSLHLDYNVTLHLTHVLDKRGWRWCQAMLGFPQMKMVISLPLHQQVKWSNERRSGMEQKEEDKEHKGAKSLCFSYLLGDTRKEEWSKRFFPTFCLPFLSSS